MSRRAQADVLVDRDELAKPGVKASIRRELLDQLGKLGHVESIERYVRDVPDGPLHEYGASGVDWGRFTVVRVIGYVTPFRH